MTLSPAIVRLIDHGQLARFGALELPEFFDELHAYERTGTLTGRQARAIVDILGLGNQTGDACSSSGLAN